MTRGKHAASAAKRRAETAEAQLDRLMPELVDAKRTAARYRSEAEAAPALRRALAELRETTGVPMPQHLQEVAELKADHDNRIAEITDALVDLFDLLSERGFLVEPDHDDEWISAKFMETMQAIPEPAALNLLTHLGLEREMRRMVLEANRNRVSHATETRSHLLNLDRRAKEAGLSGIPASWVRHAPMTTAEVIERYRNESDDEA